MVLAMIPVIPPASSLLTFMFNLGAGAGALAVLYLVEARALDRRRPWAVAAVRPLLLVIAAGGIYAIVDAFGAGRIRVPFDLALVAWAWLGAPDAGRVPRPSRRSVALVGVAIAVALSMALGSQLYGWGGVLDVREPDLTASIEVDCGPSAAGPPPTITIAYDWSWRSSSPLPSGVDIVVVGWTGADELGRPLYLLDKTPDPGGGIHPGLRDYPSVELAATVAAESVGSWNWGIQLSEQRFAPGHFEGQLLRTREVAPGPRTLVVTASYVHLGLWRHDIATVTCTW
jgi:hypothetical protein